MMRSLKHRVALGLASALIASSISLSAASATDAAAPADVSIGDIIALTLYLPFNDEAAAEAAAKAVQMPGSAQYHRFLSVPQFVNSYGATDNQIANLEATLKNLGFTIQYVYPNHLAVEAFTSVGAAETVFGVKLEHVTQGGHSGIASTTPALIPAALAGKILGVGGFDTVTRPRPRHMSAAFAPVRAAASARLMGGGTAGNYLPADFQKYYDVDSIYRAGTTGRGSTIGIVTLNDFNAHDAYVFWQQIGLNVSPSRITKVNVDGGETAPGFTATGEGETDIDVEQSGAMAPGAQIRVYIAPNLSDANFINGFEAAASENLADTVSTSWGQPELLYFYNVATQTTGDSFLLQVFHSVFLEMALQGQTVVIASGDSGSYDTVTNCPYFGVPTAKSPTCSAPLAVDHPGSDPLVTDAGGTTVPYAYTIGGGIKLSVQHEQAWGWRYIAEEFAAQGAAAQSPISSVFSTGGGGGVSSYWPLPWYQLGVSGMTVTNLDQVYSENTGHGSVVQVVLPDRFAGRNVPDISANADPQSGYQFIQESIAYDFEGGTSFVAPQINGVAALFVQALGGRIGQLNPALYRLGSPASTDIVWGNDWGYIATRGFDGSSGVGALDAAKLLVGLFGLEYGQSSAPAARARARYLTRAGSAAKP